MQAIPTGGLVCPGAPVGAGVGESSYSAIGAAINAWRAGPAMKAHAGPPSDKPVATGSSLLEFEVVEMIKPE